MARESVFDALTEAEADKIARLEDALRDRLPAVRVTGCHAVGRGDQRVLCFTRADGQLVACVSAVAFLDAADAQAAGLITPLVD